MNRVYIIAEAGVNHNGDPSLAFQLIDVAAEAGVDAVKFQTFNAKDVVTKEAVKAAYQQRTTKVEESQYEMLKQLELDHVVHRELISYCKQKGIEFLSTAFDLSSLRFLVNDLRLEKLKISSGEITNGPFLLEHALTGCDLVLSTGMSTLGEVEEALGVLAYGFCAREEPGVAPSRRQFRQSYDSVEGQAALKEKVTLLHCTTEYPAPVSDINLNAMKTLHNAFGLTVGYSDHSAGITVPVVASALGASVVEKHFTLDRTLPGPDHAASIEPNELKEMVEAIRITEQVLGDGVKRVMPSERDNLDKARRSLVAASSINEGESFTDRNIMVKRPGHGITPMAYWEFLEHTASMSFEEGDLIQ